MTQEELSKAVGKSRPAIANAVRLLNMPEEVQKMLKNGELSAGQAKAIAAAETEEDMIELANECGIVVMRTALRAYDGCGILIWKPL